MKQTTDCTQIGQKTAAKFDQGKLRYDLIPPEADFGLAMVLSYGANKYEDRNWEKGTRWMRIVGAIKRHLAAFEMGQDVDPTTGLLHIDQVATNVAFLQTFVRRRIGTDDRVAFFKRHPHREDMVTTFKPYEIKLEEIANGGSSGKSKSSART